MPSRHTIMRARCIARGWQNNDPVSDYRDIRANVKLSGLGARRQDEIF